MSSRPSPTQRLHAELDELLASGVEPAAVIEHVARVGARLLLQAALEAESPPSPCPERRSPGHLLAGTTDGMPSRSPLLGPQPRPSRGADERFARRLLGARMVRTNALEATVIASLVRGLSVRESAVALAEALGGSTTVSRSTVSKVCASLAEEYRVWSNRRLEDVGLDYMFLEASKYKYHAKAVAETLLAAWGVDQDGKPLLIGLASAAAESSEAWKQFLTDLGARGLTCPLLVISDDEHGLTTAMRTTMPTVRRQACLGHRERRVLAEVPKELRAQVRADYRDVFRIASEVIPGTAAEAWVQTRIDDFADRWQPSCPAAVGTLLVDRHDLTAHLRFPREHWTRICLANLFGWTFGEARRRPRVVGRLPGEQSCLRLVWAVLHRASTDWPQFVTTPTGRRLLQGLRHDSCTPQQLQQFPPPSEVGTHGGTSTAHASTGVA